MSPISYGGSGFSEFNSFSGITRFRVGDQVEVIGNLFGNQNRGPGTITRETSPLYIVRFLLNNKEEVVQESDLISINNNNNTMAKFKKGDKVVFIENMLQTRDKGRTPNSDKEYTIYDTGSNITNEKNKTQEMFYWLDNRSNTYAVDSELELANQKPKEPASMKHLDKLILDQTVKEEIIAVLRQHENSKKIFEEWGLGETIEYGKGMTFLFWGGPGTGKTFGANCIAKALGKELLIIGAAEIQTSEPGGANRAIQEAFKAAGKKKILFIDECDSLIFDRKNLGMVLGSEVNTLLTEIEKSEGVVILATNRISDMDAALERRMSLIIEFPHPTFSQRLDIWKNIIPSKMPLDKDVDLEIIAKVKLTGGLIKNVLLQTARLAVSEGVDKVQMKHFDKALSRVVKSQSLMGVDRVNMQREDPGTGTGKGDKTRTTTKVGGLSEFLKSRT